MQCESCGKDKKLTSFPFTMQQSKSRKKFECNDCIEKLKCSVCGLTKEYTAYYHDHTRPRGFKHACISCERKRIGKKKYGGPATAEHVMSRREIEAELEEKRIDKDLYGF